MHIYYASQCIRCMLCLSDTAAKDLWQHIQGNMQVLPQADTFGQHKQLVNGLLVSWGAHVMVMT